MAYAHSCPVVSGRSVYKLGIGSFLFIVLSGRTTGDQAGEWALLKYNAFIFDWYRFGTIQMVIPQVSCMYQSTLDMR